MIQENLTRIRRRIAESAQRAGRSPDEIRLVCIAKNASSQQVKEAVACGITDLGENRVQEALLKYEQLGETAKRVNWHMVGHLQTNKVKKALDIFATIHSLDSLSLASEIDRRAAVLGKSIDCFIEVNTSGEASKYGIRPEETAQFIREASQLPHLRLIGLMTITPFYEDAELTRPYFKKLRNVRDGLRAEKITGTEIRELSMGMSQDFEVAVEEGATFIRIGRAIFNG